MRHLLPVLGVCCLLFGQKSPFLPGVTMIPQRDTPATLISLSHTTGRSFSGGVFINKGKKVIVEARLGWRILQPKGKPQIGAGEWTKMSLVLQPGKTGELPARAAYLLPPVSEQKTRIEFYIAALKFQDGTSWEEKVTRLDEYLRPKPRAGATR